MKNHCVQQRTFAGEILHLLYIKLLYIYIFYIYIVLCSIINILKFSHERFPQLYTKQYWKLLAKEIHNIRWVL